LSYATKSANKTFSHLKQVEKWGFSTVNNACSPLVINFDESPTTCANDNNGVKKKHNFVFHLSLNLPIKTTKFGGCNGENQCHAT
jgi:hypothetical protein